MSTPTWVFLGASRGLGLALTQELQRTEPSARAVSFSRKTTPGMDFAKVDKWPRYVEEIEKLNPDRILYFAGGGPYGDYGMKAWADHQWAFRVNFEFPAFLLHHLLSKRANFLNLRQLLFIGSAIAESNADPGASSYSAAKHALRGLLLSLQAEKPDLDMRLYSPGYMDTKLLPANAWPRQAEGIVKAPGEVASDCLAWLLDPSFENSHRVFTVAASDQ